MVRMEYFWTAAPQVDHHDDDPGDGVALHELHRAVEIAVQLALHLEQAAAALGLVLVDQARAQIGIDRQLLARHGVQAEAGGDLGHPFGALGDDDELHDGDDQEDHQADDQIAARHHVAEGVDDRPGVAFQQDHPRRRDRQRQPEQGRDQQQAGEDRDVDDRGDVDRHQQHHHARADVDGHQGVDRQRRQGHDHHGDDRRHPRHQEQVRIAADASAVVAQAQQFQRAGEGHGRALWLPADQAERRSLRAIGRRNGGR